MKQTTEDTYEKQIIILISLFLLQSWMLMLIVVLISMGLCMFTYKSTQFNMLGFIFLILASITSAIRWTFAQFIMQKSKLGLHNPIDMIYFMQPWMILPLLPLTLGFEGKFHWIDEASSWRHLSNLMLHQMQISLLQILLIAKFL